MTFLRDLFTGTNGQHWELCRVSIGYLGVSLVGLQVYAILHGQNFEPLNFGGGAAALLAAGGFGTAAKDNAKVNADQAAGGGDAS